MALDCRQSWQRELNQTLTKKGFRFTSQRQQVYSVLLEQRDHPTAEQVFMRAKKAMPDISIATVYNCLDALVKCHLVNEVNVDRGATRFCPNMEKHVHFYCEQCGGVFDVQWEAEGRPSGLRMPHGFRVDQFEMSLRGLCCQCAQGASEV